MHPLLQSIQKRPAMYLGPFPIYDKLTAYIAGYKEACQAASNSMAPLIPQDFYAFVSQRLGESSHALGWRGLIARRATGVQGWDDFLPKNTVEDQAALDLFFELLNAYDQPSPPAA